MRHGMKIIEGVIMIPYWWLYILLPLSITAGFVWGRFIKNTKRRV
jgi:hypothetical protein